MREVLLCLKGAVFSFGRRQESRPQAGNDDAFASKATPTKRLMKLMDEEALIVKEALT